MKIQLKKWQSSMFVALLEQLPEYPITILRERICMVTYGDLSIGNGWYSNGKVEISPAIRHPRLFIERSLHECGHAIEEWLSQNGYNLYSCNLDQIADGFALSILYPRILDEPHLKKVRKIFAESIFIDAFPVIETEKLIEKYICDAEALIKMSIIRQGLEVANMLWRIYESQSEGFLRRYSQKFVRKVPHGFESMTS